MILYFSFKNIIIKRHSRIPTIDSLMINLLKTTFSDSEDVTHETYVENNLVYHGKRAVKENQAYQIDRLWKQNFILVNVITEGYD